MNSWHSFSPNSRWMVFSSKANTPYTQMFLTHIDENGNDTPPILIPNSTAANRAVNLPEFVNRDYAAFNSIDIPAVAHHQLLQDGLDAIDDGKYEEARGLLEAALDQEPDFTGAMVPLSVALFHLGERDQALETVATAASLSPHDANIRNSHGFLLLQLGRADEAVGEFRAAIEEFPIHPDAHTNLGDALRELGRPGDAIKEYRRSLELNPGDPRISRSLLELLQQQGRHAEVVPLMETLLVSTPNDQMLRLTLAWLLATLPEDDVRNGKRAVALAEQVRNAQGERAGNLDVLAAAYAEVGRFEDAVRTALRAKELQAQGRGQAAPGLDQRIWLYKAGRPHRQ
jgi:tetratricopeptide (TPR) repeat protein